MIKKLKAVAAEWLPDVLMVAGAGCLSYSGWLVDPALGWASAGTFALCAGLLLAMRGGK